jgi:hypothetical protein
MAVRATNSSAALAEKAAIRPKSPAIQAAFMPAFNCANSGDPDDMFDPQSNLSFLVHVQFVSRTASEVQ